MLAIDDAESGEHPSGSSSKGPTHVLSLWTAAGGRMCAALGEGEAECCTPAGSLVDGGAWQHVAVSVVVPTGRVALYVAGRAAAACRTAAGTRPQRGALPRRVFAALFRGAPGRRGGGGGDDRVSPPATPFQGAVDDLMVSSAALSAEEVAGLVGEGGGGCGGVECAPCAAGVDAANVVVAGGAAAAVALAAAAPVHPLGLTAFAVAGSAECRWREEDEEDEEGDVLVSAHVLRGSGAPALSAAGFAGAAGCLVVCDAAAAVVRLEGCGREVGVSSAMTHVGGGWFHCVARLRRRRGGGGGSRGGAGGGGGAFVARPDAATTAGFAYRRASACGDGVVDYPHELCDPAVPAAAARCLPELCTTRSNPPENPKVELRFDDANGGVLATLSPPPPAAAPLLFLSRRENCSDSAAHHVVESGGTVPAGDDVFVFAGGAGSGRGGNGLHSNTGRASAPSATPPPAHDAFVCAQVFPESDPASFAAVDAVRLFACAARCLHGGRCNPLTGACVCPLGYQGAACGGAVDGCSVGPDDAPCLRAAAAAAGAVPVRVWAATAAGSRSTASFLSPRSRCDATPCEANGGTCGAGGVCLCPAGFAPPHCEGCLPGLSGSACAATTEATAACRSACVRGVCAAAQQGGEVLAAVCVCEEGWRGPACDEAAAVFAGVNGWNVTRAGDVGARLSVAAGGRRVVAAAEAASGSPVVLALPDVDADYVLSFAVASAGKEGVRVGVCVAGGGGELRWGLQLGNSAFAFAPAAAAAEAAQPLKLRGLGVHGAGAWGAALRVDADSGALYAAFGAHSMLIASEVCRDLRCYGCAVMPIGSSLTLL